MCDSSSLVLCIVVWSSFIASVMVLLMGLVRMFYMGSVISSPHKMRLLGLLRVDNLPSLISDIGNIWALLASSSIFLHESVQVLLLSACATVGVFFISFLIDFNQALLIAIATNIFSHYSIMSDPIMSMVTNHVSVRILCPVLVYSVVGVITVKSFDLDPSFTVSGTVDL